MLEMQSILRAPSLSLPLCLHLCLHCWKKFARFDFLPGSRIHIPPVLRMLKSRARALHFAYFPHFRSMNFHSLRHCQRSFTGFHIWNLSTFLGACPRSLRRSMERRHSHRIEDALCRVDGKLMNLFTRYKQYSKLRIRKISGEASAYAHDAARMLANVNRAAETFKDAVEMSDFLARTHASCIVDWLLQWLSGYSERSSRMNSIDFPKSFSVWCARSKRHCSGEKCCKLF